MKGVRTQHKLLLLKLIHMIGPIDSVVCINDLLTIHTQESSYCIKYDNTFIAVSAYIIVSDKCILIAIHF